ncbi:MAG TPA: heavy metal-binding domain-containing protein [Solirubrobacteraceae bacterium]|nr:heavy metal-binding domain-containing protein [Solirubrobacteraceae bacterium]
MSPFGRNKPAQPTDEERRAAEVDLERIRQGGIPLGAEERLKRVANASTPFFTSDLSAKEYALAQAGSLQPVAQVMGSSVVKHGWQGQQFGTSWGHAEVRSLSDPWNMARTRAFNRLREEARLAGADGVIGIEISAGSAFDGADTVEFVVFGTAVRDHAFPAGKEGELAMCGLSGQDVDKLRRLGAQVCELVGYTTVISVALQPGSNYLMNSSGFFGGGSRNAEITEVVQGVYEARRMVMSEVRRQASFAGADHLVVSTLEHSIAHREYEAGGTTHHYFYVTMHMLGTAIRMGARKPHPAPLRSPLVSINLGDQDS